MPKTRTTRPAAETQWQASSVAASASPAVVDADEAPASKKQKTEAPVASALQRCMQQADAEVYDAQLIADLYKEMLTDEKKSLKRLNAV